MAELVHLDTMQRITEELISSKYYRIIQVQAFALLLSHSSTHLGNGDEEGK